MASVDPSLSIKIDSLPQDENFIVQNTGPRVLYYAKPDSKADISGFSKKARSAADGRYIVLSEAASVIITMIKARELAILFYKPTRLGCLPTVKWPVI